MKLLLLTFILTFPFASNAQFTATFNETPDHLPQLVVRNTSPVAVTAFAITMAPIDKGSPLVAFVDTLIDRRAVPLQPNEEHAVPVGIRFRPGKPPQQRFQGPIMAVAIFADGSTTGDRDLLHRLILRRCNMLQAVEATLEILADAGRHNVPRDQPISQFQRMANSLDHWYLPPEQQAGRILYQSIIAKLMSLPEPQVGSPFPPTAFVEQERALLNRQRVILLESQPGLADDVLRRR